MTKTVEDIKGLVKIDNSKAFLLKVLPYIGFFYLGNIFSHHVRSYLGADVIDRIFQAKLELRKMSYHPSLLQRLAYLTCICWSD
ncbi:MAG: hypothetical protein Q4P34_06720 [Tissierellia bacterium]|nr:hypothetical protein [Tissierellia bacterium]